jgi:hypothetical protein
MDILAALKHEEAKLQQQLTGIQGAITALTGARKPASRNMAAVEKGVAGKRVMSAAVRAKLSKKAKARWARIKAEQSKGKKPK